MGFNRRKMEAERKAKADAEAAARAFIRLFVERVIAERRLPVPAPALRLGGRDRRKIGYCK
jgi:hypothetical protein